MKILNRRSLFLLLSFLVSSALAQDRLKTMPGYDRYQRITKASSNAVELGSLTVTWTNEGKAFEYRKAGKRFRYDIESRTVTELVSPPKSNAPPAEPPVSPERTRTRERSSGRTPARGRQYRSAISPDSKYKAFYRNRNLWLSDTNDANPVAVTVEGNEISRIKFGTASWVYGEELFQNTAIWWSTNSKKVAFYRFDESSVPDYHLALNQTRINTTLDREPYVKAGATNPIVDIFIYDLETRKMMRVDVRDGKPFDNDVVGHYVYGVSWSDDSEQLLFHRTNRRQNIMEFCAADPETEKCRVLVREEWPASWTENSPTLRGLKGGQRFIWSSERTGWKNFYLYSIQGELLATLTRHPFEVASIVHVDETSNRLYYTARSGDNPMKLQLHRVGLDGKGDERLTDPAFHHSIDMAPDGRHYIDIAQTHDSPPVTHLREAGGRLVAELARSDLKRFNQIGLKRVELFRFKAADGVTDLYGLLHFPSNFKSSRKYPLLVSVYAGPGSPGARETFITPNALTEFGFLVATFDSRSASGRGKRFLDSIYQKLGQVEIDDQAAGVKSLWNRRYVDRKRVGMYGTSYGGTVSITCLLRYPDIFHAACASSPVTDYRNYDSIYTERYMGLPQENKAGYDAASLMTHVKNLKGRLMLFFGTADDNVHPSNALQLIQALQRAGKSFEVQVGPDQGHTSMNRDRMMEFFIEHLVK